MYWAVVTMTTVGYGDVSPTTVPGKALAACMMILGYCMIIVPTGIVTSELAHVAASGSSTQVCPECAPIKAYIPNGFPSRIVIIRETLGRGGQMGDY